MIDTLPMIPMRGSLNLNTRIKTGVKTKTTTISAKLKTVHISE